MNANQDHSISLADAAKMTKAFRNSVSSGAIIAQAFGKNAIMDILNQQGVVGLRLYYALDDLGIEHLVAVGTDSSGNDKYTGLLAERTLHCPDDCSEANPLNSNVTS